MARSSGPVEPVKIRTTLTGTSPLSMHNVRLANPDDEITKAIADITAKRKKTESDRIEIARLEFLGGLYLSEGRVGIPVMHVRRCFQEAAKVMRKGKDITRAVNNANPGEPMAELAFPGQGMTPEELWDSGKYHEITMVRVTGRVARCRPTFPQWGLSVDWLLLPDFMDPGLFEDIAHDAGQIEGLGDNRVNGYGRFSATVTRL